MPHIIKDLIIMESQGQIRQRINIQNFLNPVTEEVDNQTKNVFETIIARYNKERDKESNEEVEEVPKISVSEALQVLKTLKIYEEQQEQGDSALTKALRGRERELQLRKTAVLRQGSISGWLQAE